jgi:hypothetical protein
MPRGDLRTGDRRMDITLKVRTDSDDTRVEEEPLTKALVERLEGLTFHIPGRGIPGAHVIDSVEIVEVITVQRGRRA